MSHFSPSSSSSSSWSSPAPLQADRHIIARPLPPKSFSTNQDVGSPKEKITRFNAHLHGAEKFKYKNLRRLEEMRNMYIKVNVMSSASGSAYLRLGDTKIIATVYGPRHLGSSSYSSSSSASSSAFSSSSSSSSASTFPPGAAASFSFSSSSRSVMTVDRGRIQIDFKIAPFAFKYLSSNQSKNREIKDLSFMLGALNSVIKLERYPMSFIDIHIHILQAHGEVFSSCLNCVGLALADASIEMHDCIAVASVYSVPIAKPNGEKEFLLALDLSSEELEEHSSKEEFSSVNMGFFPSRGSLFFLNGEKHDCLDDNHFQNVLNLGEAACRAIGEEIQKCLRYSHVKKLRAIEKKNIAIYGKKIYRKKEKAEGEESETETEEEEVNDYEDEDCLFLGEGVCAEEDVYSMYDN